MAYYTERQKMELSLVECIVEPHHSINSSSSRSSDVTASSIESDGDAPVIVVSHSRYDVATLSVLLSLH